MIHLNKNSSILAQKVDLENGVQLLKEDVMVKIFHWERYSAIGSSQPLKEHFYLKSMYNLICVRVDQILHFSIAS